MNKKQYHSYVVSVSSVTPYQMYRLRSHRRVELCPPKIIINNEICKKVCPDGTDFCI